MHYYAYLNNTMWNFKFTTNTKLYKIKYLTLKQHWCVYGQCCCTTRALTDLYVCTYVPYTTYQKQRKQQQRRTTKTTHQRLALGIGKSVEESCKICMYVHLYNYYVLDVCIYNFNTSMIIIYVCMYFIIYSTN